MTLVLSRLAQLTLAVLMSPAALAVGVIMETPQGPVTIELFKTEAPNTVQNFLNYVRDGDFDNTFVHRSIPGIVIQGGGFTWVDDQVGLVPADPPVASEAGISNTRGTIAMARLAGQPDSATSQWFINVADNSAELDEQDGGFTVFGRVVKGLQNIDEIAALQTWNLGSPFDDWPLIDYPGSGNVTSEYIVFTSFTIFDEFTINPGLNDAWFNPATNGQGFFIIVFPDIPLMFLAWFTYDTERPAEDVTANLGDPGHRWITAQGGFEGDTATLDVLQTTGGVFDFGDPAPENSIIGNMEVVFGDCTQGLVKYDIPGLGLKGEVPIQRIANDNVPLCEALLEE